MRKRNFMPFFLVLALTFTLLSCSADKSAASDNGYSYAAQSKASYAQYDEAASDVETAPASFGASDAARTGETSSANDLSARKIIRTANLTFETKEYDPFIQSVSSCVAAHGGYFESSESYGAGIYSSGGMRSANMTIRIPADRYDAFMEAVSEIGAMTYRSESESDVTMTYVDIESRIRALETEHATLLQILEKAESLTDVIQLQSRISEVNYQLDSYKSQIRKYDDLISYCTVHLYVSEVRRETVPNEEKLSFGERIGVGLRENLRDIGEFFTDFTVWFITSLPTILIWCAVIAAIIVLIRLLLKKRRKRKEQKQLKAYLKAKEYEANRTSGENGSDRISENNEIREKEYNDRA